MSAGELTFYFALTVLGFVLSALFSGLETGVYTLNRVRLTLRLAAHDGRAGILRREMRRPTRMLAVLLIGTNASNYLGSYGLAAAMHGAGFSDTTLIVLQATVFALLLFLLAETLPKELFRQHTDHWTYLLAPMITVSRWAVTVVPILPIVQLFTWSLARVVGQGDHGAASARADVSHMIKEGVGAGVVSADQSTLADRALAYRDADVGRVQVPWREVVSIPLDAPPARRETLLRGSTFTRLPVVDARGEPAGMLAWLDAATARDRPTAELMRPVTRIPADTRVMDALLDLQLRREAMAIVTDPRSGRPTGLCTIKDLIEPLTGRLPW